MVCLTLRHHSSYFGTTLKKQNRKGKPTFVPLTRVFVHIVTSTLNIANLSLVHFIWYLFFIVWSFESLSEKNLYHRSKPCHWISTSCTVCFAKMWLMWGWQEGEAKLIFVSLISYMVPSEKPSCSKVSPDVNLLIAWFPSTPLIHWSNLSSGLSKGKKKTNSVFPSAIEIPTLVLCLLLSQAYGLILDKREGVGICLLPGEKFFASLPGKTSDPVAMIFLLIGMQRSYLFITPLLLITTPLAHSPQMSSLYIQPGKQFIFPPF